MYSKCISPYHPPPSNIGILYTSSNCAFENDLLKKKEKNTEKTVTTTCIFVPRCIVMQSNRIEPEHFVNKKTTIFLSDTVEQQNLLEHTYYFLDIHIYFKI